MKEVCSICQGRLDSFDKIDGYSYYICTGCETIQVNPDTLMMIDQGRNLRDYDTIYWQEEIQSAKERSYGAALARFAELVLYTRRPINRFIDVGSGPGFLLDSLSIYLPGSSEKFYACELFPPDEHTSHQNYFKKPLAEMPGKFDAGLCIEVIEHLTPTQLGKLAKDLATKSEEDSLFLFNTGLSSYVISEDRSYLDPIKRGHIVSYSIKAIKIIFEPYGFVVHELQGKKWAFLVEYRPSFNSVAISERIWSPKPENRNILNDNTMGNLMYILGIDTARAYL